jgi:hypothetical protein
MELILWGVFFMVVLAYFYFEISLKRKVKQTAMEIKQNLLKEKPDNKSSTTINYINNPNNGLEKEKLGVLSDIEIKQKIDKLNVDINFLLVNFMHETGRAFISDITIMYNNSSVLSTNLKCNITDQNFVMPLSLVCNEKYKN